MAGQLDTEEGGQALGLQLTDPARPIDQELSLPPRQAGDGRKRLLEGPHRRDGQRIGRNDVEDACRLLERGDGDRRHTCRAVKYHHVVLLA